MIENEKGNGGTRASFTPRPASALLRLRSVRLCDAALPEKRAEEKLTKTKRRCGIKSDLEFRRTDSAARAGGPLCRLCSFSAAQRCSRRPARIVSGAGSLLRVASEWPSFAIDLQGTAHGAVL